MSVSRTKSATWAMVGVSILAATASTASAQVSPETPSTSTVPVREVTAPLAKATRPINGANMLRALPDGSIFINDVQRRQLLRFDPTLQNVVVVADTAAGALMPYGQRPIGLIPYLGDSSIVVDPATLSMVVLNKDGKTVRVMASPRTNDVNTLSNMNLGSHAFDQQGRLYYRQGNAGGGPGGGGMAMMFGSGNDRGGGGRGGQGGQGGQGGNTQPQGRGGAQPARPTAGDDPAFRGGGQGGGQPFGGPGGRGFNPQSQPDSVPIVRVNFDTRKADTVAFVKVPKNETQMTRGEDGSTKIAIKINPLPQADDWALLNDGTVAVMRVLDFHVDYYRPDGSHIASDKLPFDWKRITDDDKTKLVDSLQTLAKAATERAAGNAGGGGGFRMSFEPVAAEKLPDYYPPIRAGTTLADFDGNLWVLPATSNLSAQLATQFMGGMGGRGGPPGAAGGAPGAPGAARASGAARTPGDTTRGTMPAAAMGMMAAMMNQPPLVYDVISPAGKMIERVKLPAGRQLLGFGPNGAIFLGARDGRQLFVEKVMRKE
ncbi:hypothetical protein [Gemmatimonas sp.]|uniref:hypothetical protein n=1 Tax=Gemmatimonas sp. TaxID=1962908 RepID=UPI00286DC2C1|nr:hypothetical protein [Gemmatimonas sp.]